MGILAFFLFVVPVLSVCVTSGGRQTATGAWQSSFADPAHPQSVRDRLGVESRKTRPGWESRLAGQGGRR